MQVELEKKNSEFVLEVLNAILKNQLSLAIKQRDDVLSACFPHEKSDPMIKDYNDELLSLEQECLNVLNSFFKKSDS